MSTTNTTPTTPMTREERFAKQVERAQNLPMFGNGVSMPVAIVYVGLHNGRRIYNFAARTERNVGGPREHETNIPEAHATMSQPEDWKVRFKQGDYVCLQIVDGYVQKMLPASAMAAQRIEINPRAVASTEAAVAGKAAEEQFEEQVDEETGEVTKKKKKAPAANANDDDLPF